MQLPVLSNREGETSDPWYAGGLRFACTQCGNCCTGPPGYVWISPVEVVRLGEFLGITPEQTVERYCRKVAGRLTLKEKRGPGGYDCIFLVEQEAAAGAEGAEPGGVSGGGVPLRRRGCSIYPVRPLQCRTWPFWPELLADPEAWRHAGRRCHGMDHGPRTFSRQQIEDLRDAQDWPENPPTSSPAARGSTKSEARSTKQIQSTNDRSTKD